MLMQYQCLYISSWLQRIALFAYPACMPQVGHLYVLCQIAVQYN